ncbi:uncharacterized protein LOC131246914 [Magnolia sinica]|uniref:uncharacterized protein LOC131246914 n=1 Tax=Magnolia sinica TaxID=86752 RepID=UPI00265ACA06|nr:uncharacterized protein LOC131246914 [Magnolia sinica]
MRRSMPTSNMIMQNTRSDRELHNLFTGQGLSVTPSKRTSCQGTRGSYETKCPNFNDRLLGSLWRAADVSWVAKDSMGSAGGILVAWKNSAWQVLNSWTGKFFVSVILQHISSRFTCCFSSIYGPSQDRDRKAFWEELSLSRQKFVGACCIAGDFDIVRNSQEKSHSRSNTPTMKQFSDWIKEEELVDLPILGARFTWSNGRESPTMCRLDRTTSDHHPISLEVVEQNWGPKPFRFELLWLSIKGFATKIVDWWKGFKVQGNADFILSVKLKMLKKELKEWHKSDMQNRDLDYSKLLSDLSALDAHMEIGGSSPDLQATRINLIQEIANRILQKEIS